MTEEKPNNNNNNDGSSIIVGILALVAIGIVYGLTDSMFLTFIIAMVLLFAGGLLYGIIGDFKKHKSKDTIGGLIGVIVITALIVVLLFSCSIERPRDINECTICGEKATHTFQGSGYCNKHYDDAIKWAIDNPKD